MSIIRAFLLALAVFSCFIGNVDAESFGRLGSMGRGFGHLGSDGKGHGASGPVIQPLRSAVSRALVGNQFVSGLAGTAVQGQTRMRMLLGSAPLSELRVCYGNWAGQGEAVGPGNLVVEAALESDGPLGVARFLWSGANTITLTPGQTACSDALLPASLGYTVFPANAAMWFRTGDTAVSSVGHPSSVLMSASGEGAWAGPAFTSQVNATGAMTVPSGGATASAGLTPFAVLGRYTVPMPSLCDIGDSISAGVNDTAQAAVQGYYTGNGYVGRSAALLGGAEIYPTFKLGIGGDGATPGGYTQRATFFQYCTHGVTGWGVNDIDGNPNAASVFANLATAWTAMHNAGIQYVYQPLITVKTTSTDQWATEERQTYYSSTFAPGGAKDQLNTLINASVGSNNLTGVINFLAAVHGTDPDKWITKDGFSYTPNVTVTVSTNAFTFSSGTFVAGDIGKNITINGAGTAGGNLFTTITGVSSTTAITTAGNASTGLVAASELVSYGTGSFATSDGLHPLGNIHALMAPFLQTALQSVGPQLPAFDTSWVPAGVTTTAGAWSINFKTGQAYGINAPIFGIYPTAGANSGTARTSVGYGVTANNSTGIPIQFGPNTARVTPGRGLIMEPTATNLFASPFAPGSQIGTVTNATQYTVSVVGTGSLTLSGACTGTVTAGSPVTCTTTSTSLSASVSGTLLAMQLETGASATTPISGTRSAEEVGFPSSPSTINVTASTAGTIVVTFEGTGPATPNQPILSAFGAGYLITNTAANVATIKTATLVATLGAAANGHTVNGITWDATGRGIGGNGGAITSDANATGMSGQQVYIGGEGSGGGDSKLARYVQMITYYPVRLTTGTTPTFQQATAP